MIPVLMAVTPPRLVESITIGQVLNLLAVLAIVIGYIWKINPFVRQLSDFFEDWNGEKARPGIEARPGVMLRLHDIEQEVTLLKRSQGKTDDELGMVKTVFTKRFDETNSLLKDLLTKTIDERIEAHREGAQMLSTIESVARGEFDDNTGPHPAVRHEGP